MKKTNFKIDKNYYLKLLLTLNKHSQKGLSLTELIVALVIGGIVLTAAASGFTNLLVYNQDVESKTVRSATLQRALTYMQQEVRSAVTITQVGATSGGNCDTSSTPSIDSDECLVLTLPDGSTVDGTVCATNPQIYYGYEDISSSSSEVFFKPGLLKRRSFCNGTGVSNWLVIADGLVSSNEATQPSPTCTQDSVNWPGAATIYGDDSGNGGFRFCLNDATADNTLVRIFLSGHIAGNSVNNMITVDTIGFARSGT